VFKVLISNLFTLSEKNRALALLSALISSTKYPPLRYILRENIPYRRASIGRGSFGKAHRGLSSNLCVKVMRTDLDPHAVRSNLSFLHVLDIPLSNAYSICSKHGLRLHTHYIRMSYHSMECLSPLSGLVLCSLLSTMGICKTERLAFHQICDCF
jgi:hypothetical protein